MAFALSGQALANDFVNGGFETGTLTGWTQSGGYLSYGVSLTPAAYAGAANSINVVSSGLDPITGLPMVYSGNYAVRINDATNNYSVNALSQTVTNYGSTKMYIAWSGVMDIAHSPGEASTFHIIVSDVTNGGNVALIDETYDAATGSPSLSGFKTASNGNMYSGWVVDDISTIIGHSYKITVVVADCIYGGHYGYVYLDTFAQSFPTANPGIVPSTSGGGVIIMPGNVWKGGAGTWNLTSSNWTDSTGTSVGTYTNGGAAATFQGTPGTVTVDTSGGAITVTGMRFLANGYTISGGSLGLSGTSADFAVGNGTSTGAGYVATINSQLTGAAALSKSDLGTLVLNAANSYTGGTVVNAGTLSGYGNSFGSGSVAIGSAGTLSVNSGSGGTLANALTGTGNFVVSGTGQLLVTGNSSFSGATFVNAGRLRVDGSLANSAVSVASGATLGGYGTVGSVNLANGAVLAPGGSIGTLTVNGNLVAQAGSTYALEVGSNGATDKVVVSGNASIAPGAKLVVTKTDAGAYQLNKRYAILSAGGTISGAYTLSGDTAVSYFYGVVAKSDGKNLYADVAQTQSYRTAGGTGNQQAAGAGVDSALAAVAAGTVIGDGTALGALGRLQSQQAGQVALDQISGEIHATNRLASLEDSANIRNAVLDGQAGGALERRVWAAPYGYQGSQESDGNAARYTHETSGFVAGSDIIATKKLVIGAYGGLGNGKVAVLDRASTADVKDTHYGAYVRLRFGKLAVDGGYGHSTRKFTTNRTVNIGALSENAQANYDLKVDQVFGRVSLALPVKRVIVEPVVGVASIMLGEVSASEVAASAGLRVNAQAKSSMVGEAGLQLRADLGGKGKRNAFTLTGSVLRRHANVAETVRVTNALTSGAGFEVASQAALADAWLINAGVEAKLGKRVNLSIAYAGVKGDGIESSGGKANLSIRF